MRPVRTKCNRTVSLSSRPAQFSGIIMERLEERTLLSAPTSFTSIGVGGGGALYGPAINPNNNSEYFIPTDMGELFHSTDSGATWSYPDLKQAAVAYGSRVQFTTNNAMWVLNMGAASGAAAPAKSTDGGATWTNYTNWNNGTGEYCRQVFVDPLDGNFIAGVGSGGHIFVSRDGGGTWNTRWAYTGTLALHVGGFFRDGSNVWFGTNDGLLKSTDSCQTNLTRVTMSGAPAGGVIASFAGSKQGSTIRFFATFYDSNVVSLWFDSSGTYNGQGIFNSCYKGVYTFTSGQTSWTNCSPSSQYAAAFVVMPSGNTETVYLGGGIASGTYVGRPAVLKSTDHGQTWTSVLDTVNNANVQTNWLGDGMKYSWNYAGSVFSMGICSSNANDVIITNLFGAWATTDGGAHWKSVVSSTLSAEGSTTPLSAYSGTMNMTGYWDVDFTGPTSAFGSATDVTGQFSTNAGLSNGNTWGYTTGTSLTNIFQSVYDAQAGYLFAVGGKMNDVYSPWRLSDGNVDGRTGALICSPDGGKNWSLVKDWTYPWGVSSDAPTLSNMVIGFAQDPTNNQVAYALVANSVNGHVYKTTNLYVNGQPNTNATWTPLATDPGRTQGRPRAMKVLNDGTLVVTYSERMGGDIFRATAADSDKILLNWLRASTDETSVTIQRATDSGFTQNLVTVNPAVGQTSYLVTGLSQNTTYFFRIKVTNAAGDSSWSWVQAARTTTPTAPAPVWNLTACAASSSQVNLSWKRSMQSYSDPVIGWVTGFNETGLKVEWATNSSFTQNYGTANVGAGTEFYTTTGLTQPLANYYFRVTAFNGAGSGPANPCYPYARVLSSTVVAPSAPNTLFASAASNSQVNLSWSYRSDFYSSSAGCYYPMTSETGFTVEYATNSNFTGSTTVNVAAGTTTKSVTGLTNGQTYYFRVRPTGTSSNSNVVSLAPTANIIKPRAVTDLGDSSGVFVSTDGGATWIDRTAPVSNGTNSSSMHYYAADVIIDPQDSNQNTWYVGVDAVEGYTPNSGLFKTTDRGQSWTCIPVVTDPIYNGVISATINANTHEMYVATASYGVYYSSNANAAVPTFTRLTSVKYSGRINRIVLNPYDMNQVWVATHGGGMELGLAGTTSYSTTLSATTGTTNNQVDLSWSSVSGAGSYRAEYSIGAVDWKGQAVWTSLGTTSATSFGVTGLTPDRQFYFRVVPLAQGSGGDMTPSSIAAGDTLSVPTGLQASPATKGQVDLAWSYSGALATGFKIERSTDNSTWSTIATLSGVSAKNWSDTGRSASTRYYYRVRAFNQDCTSSPSTSAIAMTLPDSTLIAYEGFNYTSGLSLNAQSGGTGWSGAWSGGGTTFNSGSLAAPSPADILFTQANSVTIGAGYFGTQSRNLATSVGGTGEIWLSYILKTGSSLSATGTEGEVTIGSIATGVMWHDYYMIATPGGYFIGSNPVTATTNQTTFIVVRIVFSANDSTSNDQAWMYLNPTPGGSLPTPLLNGVDLGSDQASTTLLTLFDTGTQPSFDEIRIGSSYADVAPQALPAAPGSLQASAYSSSQINLTWADNANSEQGFRVYESTDNSTFSLYTTMATPNTTSCSVTGLSPSTQYWFRVMAYNAGGESSASNSANATTQAAVPAAPSGLSASAASSSQINLTWTDNASNEQGFKVYKSTDGSSFSLYTTIATPNTASYSVTGLSPSTQYWFKVTAYNGSGESSYSGVATGTTQSAGVVSPQTFTSPAHAIYGTGVDTLAWGMYSWTVGGLCAEAGNALTAVTPNIDWNSVGDDVTSATISVHYYDVSYDTTHGVNISFAAFTQDPAVYGYAATYDSGSKVNVTLPSTSYGNSSTPYTIDITQVVQYMKDHSSAVYGIRVALQDYGYAAQRMRFDWDNATEYGPAELTIASSEMATPPAAPTSLSATTVSSSQINLSWTDNASNEQGFKVYKSTDGVNYYLHATISTPNTTSYSVTGLTPAIQYSFKVQAYNGSGSSSDSNTATATTQASSGLYVYEGFNYTSGQGLNGDNGGLGFSGAWSTSYCNVVSGSLVPPSPANALAESGNSADEAGWNSATRNLGTTYGADGTTLWVSVVEKTEQIASGVYVGYLGLGNIAIGVVRVDQWGVAYNGAYQETGVTANVGDTKLIVCRIDFHTSGDHLEMYLNPTPGLSSPDTSKLIDHTFTGTHTTFSSISLSAPGQMGFDEVRIGNSYAEAVPDPVPNAPAELTAKAASSTEIDLAWKACDQTQNGFRIEYALVGAAWQSLTSVGPEFIGYRVSGLMPAKTYQFRVFAFNTGGDSSPSDVAVCSTMPVGLPGDADGNGLVDQNDYAAWYDHYGLAGCGVAGGDFNLDGKVDQDDYAIWYDNYGCGTAAVQDNQGALSLLDVAGGDVLPSIVQTSPVVLPLISTSAPSTVTTGKAGSLVVTIRSATLVSGQAAAAATPTRPHRSLRLAAGSTSPCLEIVDLLSVLA